MNIYVLSRGEYSDYTEIYLSHPNKLTKANIIKMISEQWNTATVKFEALKENMWIECEQLFGERKWPYHGKFTGKKGNVTQFYQWRDKWDVLIPYNGKLFKACELAGFTVLKPLVTVHCNWDWEEFFEKGGQERID